jgi:lipoprotein-anchoring transpeptidase ErfK/SrfK
VPKTKPNKATLIAVFISALLILLAIVGVGVAYANKSVFYPGVSVGHEDVGGLTPEEARAKLAAQVASAKEKPVNVAVPDVTKPREEATGLYPEETVSTTTEKLGLSIDTEKALAEAWQIGHKKQVLGWLGDLVDAFFGNPSTIALTATIDPTKVRAFIDTEVAPKAAPPQPAKVVVTGKEVAIADPVAGLSIDSSKLEETILSAVYASLDADPLAFRLPPTLADSPVGRTTIQPVADTLDQLANTKVSIAVAEIKLFPTREELLQWYTPSMNEKGEVALSVNASRISTYLQRNGKELDQQKTLASITKAATGWIEDPKSSATVTAVLKPSTAITAGSYKAGLFEGKYVYVNLAEQKLYRLNGQTMEKVYRVSTGAWSTPTPRGTFAIAGKIPRAYSRTYGLYMPYWQNFLGTASNGEDLPTGSYGLHELPEWPNGYKEGRGHLGIAVSHGCIRLGVGDAKEVYDWTESGTKVVIE